MIEIKIIKSLTELDQILPLILMAREKIPHDGTLSGFLGWLVFCLPLDTFSIWVVYKNGTPIGFVVCTIEMRYFEPRCVVVTAYASEDCGDAMLGINDEVVDWAKKHNCRAIECYTNRDAGIGRRFGFDKSCAFMYKSI